MNNRITADGTQLGATVEIESTALIGNAPINFKKLSQRPQKLGFTLCAETFGNDVPEYDNPEVLAAWLIGYFAGQHHMLEHTKTEIPQHEIMMRKW